MVVDLSKGTESVSDVEEEDLEILFLKMKELELRLEVILVQRLADKVAAS